MVPRVGVEPTWALSPLDFESSAYTNFATPAREFMMIDRGKPLVKTAGCGAPLFFAPHPCSKGLFKPIWAVSQIKRPPRRDN